MRRTATNGPTQSLPLGVVRRPVAAEHVETEVRGGISRTTMARSALCWAMNSQQWSGKTPRRPIRQPALMRPRKRETSHGLSSVTSHTCAPRKSPGHGVRYSATVGKLDPETPRKSAAALIDVHAGYAAEPAHPNQSVAVGQVGIRGRDGRHADTVGRLSLIHI